MDSVEDDDALQYFMLDGDWADEKIIDCV